MHATTLDAKETYISEHSHRAVGFHYATSHWLLSSRPAGASSRTADPSSGFEPKSEQVQAAEQWAFDNQTEEIMNIFRHRARRLIEVRPNKADTLRQPMW